MTKYLHLTTTIRLNKKTMQTGADLANALTRVAKQLMEEYGNTDIKPDNSKWDCTINSANITDCNENYVGDWKITQVEI